MAARDPAQQWTLLVHSCLYESDKGVSAFPSMGTYRRRAWKARRWPIASRLYLPDEIGGRDRLQTNSHTKDPLKEPGHVGLGRASQMVGFPKCGNGEVVWHFSKLVGGKTC